MPESRPKSRRLLLDVLHFMKLEDSDRTSAEFLPAGDSLLFIRRASDWNDAKPLITEDVIDIALNLSRLTSDSCASWATLVTEDIAGAVEAVFSSSASLFCAELN